VNILLWHDMGAGMICNCRRTWKTRRLLKASVRMIYAGWEAIAYYFSCLMRRYRLGPRYAIRSTWKSPSKTSSYYPPPYIITHTGR
jgi:hypothetical protein